MGLVLIIFSFAFVAFVRRLSRQRTYQ